LDSISFSGWWTTIRVINDAASAGLVTTRHSTLRRSKTVSRTVHRLAPVCAEMPLTTRQVENLQIFEKECMRQHLRSVECIKRTEIGTRLHNVEKKWGHLMWAHLWMFID
jgi:hypothetical protein